MRKPNRIRTLFLEWKDAFKLKPLYFPFSIIYIIASGLFPLVGILCQRLVINEIVDNTEVSKIWQIVFYMAIAMVLLGTIKNLLASLLNYQCMGIRINEFNKVNKFFLNTRYSFMEDPNFMDEFEKDSRTLNSDGTGYQAVLTNTYMIGALFVSIILYLVLSFQASYFIFIAISIGFVFNLLFGYLAKRYSYKRKKEETRIDRRFTYYAETTENFLYGKDIYLFSLKDKLKSAMKSEALLFNRLKKSIANKEFLYGLLDAICTLLSEGVAYYIIIKKGINGEISLGDLSLYLSCILAASISLREIAKLISQTTEWLGYSADYYYFLNDKKYLLNEEGIKEMPSGTLEIEFKDVSFKYPNTNNYIINHLNLKIDKKMKLAIVGLNGAGKTTIVKLLCGMFDIDEGEILINGKNIKDYNRKTLYAIFSIVFQDVNIFAFTIAENIALKEDSKIDYDKLNMAIDKAGLREKIDSLPLREKTMMLKNIDTAGIELSGGESQKLAIARAIYNDGNCLILDEPTSALDALAEAEIYEKFSQITSDKTTIFISHRLASTKFCDKIALFDKAGLKEFGTHEELMKLKGLYYEMFLVQGKYYKEGVKNNEEF